MTQAPADLPVRHAPHTQWLAETVRLAENRWGPYDDSDIVRRLRHAELPLDEAVLTRNVELARREGLPEVARRWRDYAWLIALLAGLIAVISGAVAGAAALGDSARPVNLFWALGGLLGLHALTFLVWLLSLAWKNRPGGLIARLVTTAASRLARLPALGAAGKRLDSTRPAVAALLPPALFGLLSRAGVLRPATGVLSHAWWLLALVSALVTLIAMLATRRYEFIWETTLLAPDTFVALTEALGRLPAALGFPVPDADTVHASGTPAAADAAAQVLWSKWLLGCLIVYGVLPRAIALILCTALVLHRRAQVAVDTASPAFAVVRERLQAPSERLGVTDAAPDHLAGVHGNATTHANHPDQIDAALLDQLSTPQARVVLGVELPEPPFLPALSNGTVINAGILDGHKQGKAMLEAFAKYPPARLLIICHTANTPDRGTLRLIGELARSAGSAFVWLSGAAQPNRIEQWRTRVHEAGLPVDAIAEDVAEARDWLNALPPTEPIR